MSYGDMRKKGEHDEEMRQFYCRSDWIVRSFKDSQETNDNELKPKLPFFWLLTEHLNDFCKTFAEGTARSVDVKLQSQFLKTIPELFESTLVYKTIIGVASDERFFDIYANDFVLMSCEIKSPLDLTFIKENLVQMVKKSQFGQLKAALPLLHFEFEKIKPYIDAFLKFSSFEPEIYIHMKDNRILSNEI